MFADELFLDFLIEMPLEVLLHYKYISRFREVVDIKQRRASRLKI